MFGSARETVRPVGLLHTSVSKSNIETEVVKMQDKTGIQERGCAVWQLANRCDGIPPLIEERGDESVQIGPKMENQPEIASGNVST